MENIDSYQQQSSYPQKIEDILKLLSGAGLSVLRVSTLTIPKLGDVIDVYVDKPLPEEEFNKLYVKTLEKLKFMPLQFSSTEPLLRFIPVKFEPKTKLKIILLSITLFTVFLTGYGLSESFYSLLGGMGNVWLGATIYTLFFLAALAIHEYGHMRASKKHGVLIDGPFFIPAPPIQVGFIGTLGAVISMKTLPPDRKSLAKLGISGPLAGYIIALIIGVIGLLLSPQITYQQAAQLVASGQAGEIGFMPVTLIIIEQFISIPPGYTIVLHPLALASFILLLVTFLNLLPIGQLDGGHVIRSFTDAKTHDLLGYAVIITMALMGLLIGGHMGAYYIMLSFILMIFKMIFGRHKHPGPANQLAKKKDYKILAIYIALVILTFPLPL